MWVLLYTGLDGPSAATPLARGIVEAVCKLSAAVDARSVEPCYAIARTTNIIVVNEYKTVQKRVSCGRYAKRRTMATERVRARARSLAINAFKVLDPPVL